MCSGPRPRLPRAPRRSAWPGCAAALVFGIVRDELVAMLRFSLPLVPAGIAIFATFYLIV